ncbi:MAG: type III-B CRISPR module-associated protein Cmr5 [Candidatus Polarisedimenticolaceae bacterium]|nr:type III-B CRISPR module-associated protein Cmr5 [Candidatus Polarisedimenticolaceae bacterium]
MQTRTQNDAILALNQINKIKEHSDKKDIQRYGVLVYRFPIMVRQNGLQQALGFIAGKSAGNRSTPEGQFLSHIAEILGLEADELTETILKAELEQYQHYTRRCLEAAIWYRRFTESLLKVDPTGEIASEKQEADNESDGA